MDRVVKLKFLLAIIVLGGLSACLFTTAMPLIMDHPASHMDDSVVGLFSLVIIIAAGAMLVLSGAYPDLKKSLNKPCLFTLYAVRLIISLVGFAGFVLGLASFLLFFDKSRSALKFTLSGWRFALIVSIGVFLWAVIEIYKSSRRKHKHRHNNKHVHKR